MAVALWRSSPVRFPFQNCVGCIRLNILAKQWILRWPSKNVNIFKVAHREQLFDTHQWILIRWPSKIANVFKVAQREQLFGTHHLPSNVVHVNILLQTQSRQVLTYTTETNTTHYMPIEKKRSDSAHSWWLFDAASLEHQAAGTLICYPTQLHYPDTEQTSHCPILIMMSTRLGSNKYQF